MKVLRQRRKAVAPVLATLMMIAVAVAMSVIIFVWSQGFLSQTSSAAGGQQSQQNIAAQSSVSIELVSFTSATSASTGCPTSAGTECAMTIVIRNVGAVAETLGSLTVTGSSSNSGFSGTFVVPTLACTPGNTLNPVAAGGYKCGGTGSAVTGTSSDITPAVWEISSGTTYTSSIPKGSSVTLKLTNNPAGADTGNNMILSGDVISFKITTSAGTFAPQQYTVP